MGEVDEDEDLPDLPDPVAFRGDFFGAQYRPEDLPGWADGEDDNEEPGERETVAERNTRTMVEDSDDEDSDDVQEQAATARNDDPSAAQPVSREDEAFEDLERGMGPDRTR